MFLSALLVITVLGGVSLSVAGVSQADTPQGVWLLVAGIGSMLLVIAAVIVGHIGVKIDANTARTASAIRDLHDLIDRQSGRLDALLECSRLSDSAKAITHRTEERNALRAAISAEVQMRDWEAANFLITEMERRFGYRDEAQRLRETIDEERGRYYQEEADRVLPFISKLFDACEWERAKQEIGRLLKAYPEEPRFQGLHAELANRRTQRKEQLVREFTQAVQRDDIDIDGGMDILKELDQYLTRAEAEALAESARKVVKGKLLQLGVRFRFAVNEERWQDALEVAVTIIEEFPNSRMAHEVNDRLKALRERAGMPANVEVTSGSKSAAGGV